jgi:hypothetical protein
MGTQPLKKQESRWAAAGRRTGWLAVFALVLALAFGYGWSVSLRHRATANLLSGKSSSTASTDPSPASGEMLPAAIRAEESRKVFYPYSVIPGGIQSIDELKVAIARDPVIAAQYAEFRLVNARIIQLERESTMHVTYRRGDHVYWTERELLLPKGELLVTDGSETALARCGNLIAETVADPGSPNEPTPQELNTPVPSPTAAGELESDDRFPGLQFLPDPYTPPTGTNLHSNGGSGPGTYVPSGPPGPIPYPGQPKTPAVIMVPEPGTAMLLLAGLLAVMLAYMRKQKNAPKNAN